MANIPDVVRQFVVKHIHSINILDILLLLRQDPLKEWGALAVASALQLHQLRVEAWLEQLSLAGLVEWRHVASERVYQYRPSTGELALGADELARWYSSHPASVISLMFSISQERIRSYPEKYGA